MRSVELGLPKDSTLAKAGPWSSGISKPIVFYGTSITQGGCASRPGMVHTAILGRQLNCPVINLGFSGNGKMEPEMADLLAELDPAVYSLDCLPNMTAAEVTERVEPFVRTLRKAHPKTPILLVEDRSYTDSFLVSSKRQRNLESRAALRAAYERLLAAGTQGLHYLPGEDLLGDDGEGTVDSSHPTDLGFMRQADAFRPVLKKSSSLKNRIIFLLSKEQRKIWPRAVARNSPLERGQRRRRRGCLAKSGKPRKEVSSPEAILSTTRKDNPRAVQRPLSLCHTVVTPPPPLTKGECFQRRAGCGNACQRACYIDRESNDCSVVDDANGLRCVKETSESAAMLPYSLQRKPEAS